MKKSFLILLLICSSIMSCSDEEVNPRMPIPDPVNNPDNDLPGVNISVPVTNEVFLVLDRVEINGYVKIDRGIKEINIYLITPDASNDLVKLASIELPGDHKKRQFSHGFRPPKNGGTGIYTLYVGAKDIVKNVIKDSVAITIHAPDLNEAAFVKAFLGVNLYSIIDWYGYSIKDPDGLDEDELYFMFELMVDKDWDQEISATEWNRFAADFNLKDKSLSAWDENRNGKLSMDEFHKVISSLAFITKWDKNKDGLVGEAEIGSGFFSSWDHNQNALLSQQEYHDRFYRYCLFSD